MLLFVIFGAKVIKRCKLCKKKQSIFRILMYLCAQHKVTLHMNIRMNIILSAGIIIAKYGYDQMPPVLWLILLLVMTGMAIILRKWILSQHILLYICMFLLGGLLTSYQEYREQKPDTYFTIDELSELDRFQITAQERRAETEQKMKGLGIENEDFGVIAAMALGDKTALDKDTKEVYSVAGANHVLAVSGLHISIIFQLLIMLLGGNRRHIFVIFSSHLDVCSVHWRACECRPLCHHAECLWICNDDPAKRRIAPFALHRFNLHAIVESTLSLRPQFPDVVCGSWFHHRVYAVAQFSLPSCSSPITMDMEYALRIGSCPDWNSSAHYLLLRAHLVLFPSYHIHCDSCRHGHSLPLLHADVAESLPASVADSRSRLLADKLDCQGIGIHHSFCQYRLPSHLLGSRCQH